ncbi:MAG: WD40 repeat domain-containing protein, partial [Planctomycetes bacterium]|nr:WD40 repeat domain-containing protein [Planctomycetota bacterium]
AYSPNGLLLASCGADMAVAVWPLAPPGAGAIRLTGHTGPVSSVAFRMDNIHLVSAGADQLVKLWKIEGNAGREVQTFRGHKDWVTATTFSKDGFHVVSASVDRHVKLWEITSRELPLIAEHASAVQAVAVSPDGSLIATGSSDRTIKLWDRKTGVEVATLTGHQHAVMFLLFAPDGKRLISLSGNPRANERGDAEIRFWEISPPREIIRTQQQLNVFGKGRLRTFSSFIGIDPAGKTLFIWYHFNDATTSTIVDAFDIDTGAPVWDKDGRPTFVESTRKVNSLAIAANGKVGVTGGRDGSVRLWDLKPNGAAVAPGGDWFLFNKVGVADLGLTSDGSTLVATSETGEIKIAKVQGREIVKAFQGHKSGVAACIVSPDGKTFATVDGDNVIKAWSIDGKELRTWDCGRHQDMFIINLAFTNDGKQIVTANANTTVYVLDLP